MPNAYTIYGSAMCFMEISHTLLKDPEFGSTPSWILMCVVGSVLYGQKYKDPLSLIMGDVEQETYSEKEVREDEASMDSASLLKTSLEGTQRMLQQAEDYMGGASVFLVAHHEL